MRRVVFSTVMVALTGCGKADPPLAGGKPVAHWIEATHSPDPKARKEAVAKLGNVGPTDAAAYPAVVAALKDADPLVRCEAVKAVLKFGPQAKDAAPTLEELARRDADARVRSSATRAVERIKAESPP